MKKISLIVPVYNLEKYLNECYKSISQQTYTNWELIFIDDGSTDRSLAICKEIAKKDSRVHVIHSTNYGVSHARNIGIEASNGEYIMFIDGDDIIEKNTLERLTSAIETYEADMCLARYYYKDNEKTRTTGIEFETLDTKQIMHYHLKFEFLSSLCFGIYNSKIIKRNKLDEEVKNYEDWEYMTNIINNSKKIICINGAFYHYITRIGSASKSKVNDNKMTAFIAAKKVKSLLKEMDEYKNELEVIDVLVLLRIMVIYSIYGVESKEYKNILKNIARTNFNKSIKSKILNKKQKLYIILISINPIIYRLMYRVKNRRKLYEK